MDKQNIWVVITTINSPTLAIKEIARQAKVKNWNIVVIGDTKTPEDWYYPNVVYLSIEQQNQLFGEFAKLIPTNHYCRKNLGYLYAIKNGATAILETDDDNIPYENFGDYANELLDIETIGGDRWVNIYRYFSDEIIWPRGLNLEKIHSLGTKFPKTSIKSSVHQFLADDDPDVDAIFRLIFKNEVKFNPNAASLAISQNCYVPFNSQNTIFYKDSFPLLYLPCFVSFRMTDIWRSFVVQRYLWSINENLVFHKATVKQIRNEHSLIKDFRDEVDGYLNNNLIVDTLSAVNLDCKSPKEKIIRLWQSLLEIKIINEDEMNIIKNWISFFE